MIALGITDLADYRRGALMKRQVSIGGRQFALGVPTRRQLIQQGGVIIKDRLDVGLWIEEVLDDNIAVLGKLGLDGG